MNGAVIYDSKYGSTEKCAVYLQKNLHENMTLIPIDHIEKQSLEIYDFLIIGSPIMFGKLSKKISYFLRYRREEILKKPFALFVCHLQPQKNVSFKNLFSDDFVKRALSCKACGGDRVCLERYSFIDRAVLKIALKAAPELKNSKIDKAALQAFIQEINEGLGNSYE